MSAPRTSRGFFKSMYRAILKVLFRVRLDGAAAEFDNERTLIVANHESFLDGLLLAAFLPVDGDFRGATRSRKAPASAGCCASCRISPVDSTSPLAIKLICRLVETGDAGGDISGGPADHHRIAHEGLRRCGVRRGPYRRDRGAGTHRGRRAQLFRSARGHLSAQAVPANSASPSSRAAQIAMPKLPSRKAAPAACRRAHAPNPARHAGGDAARSALCSRHFSMRARPSGQLSAGRGRAHAGGVVRLAAAHVAGAGAPAEAAHAAWEKSSAS